MKLVTLDEAKDFVSQAFDHDDKRITVLIEANSAIVVNYLKDQIDFLDSNELPETDDNGDATGIPEPVRIAVLALVYNDYNGITWDNGQGRLPANVEAILYPLRDPALA